MKLEEIESNFRKTIDQYFKQKYSGDDNHRQAYIAGILQAALYILPIDNYYALKSYVYKTYDYDPGGAADGQINIYEQLEESYKKLKQMEGTDD